MGGETNQFLRRDTGNTFLSTIEQNLNYSFQANTLWIALGTSIGSMLVVTLLFSLLRPHNTTVYAPKTKHANKQHAPPPIGKGLFAWFSPLVATREAQLVDNVGMDAVIFLRFTKMLRNIFLVLSFVGCGILIPVHMLKSEDYPTASATQQAFATMTPQYVLQGTPMWSHVVCSWTFDIVIVYFLWRNYRAVVRLKSQYFESADYQDSLHSRTIWLTDIPRDAMSDAGICRITSSIEPTASQPQANIAHGMKKLPALIEEYDQAVRKLESVLAKYLKNPDKLPATRPTLRPSKQNGHGQQVDAIEYLTKRIRELQGEIYETRDMIHRSDSKNDHTVAFKPLSYGFATYESIEEAHGVAYAAKKTRTGKMTVKLAPKTNDLIWNNLALSTGNRSLKRFWNNVWVALLTVVWIVPNALIAVFLARLANLSAVWPAFAKTFNGSPNTWAAVQAIAAPGLTSLVYLLLPILFRRLQNHAGDMTKTSREHHVMHRLYAFFVFNNLIVFSTISGVWSFISVVVGSSEGNMSVWEAITYGDLPSKIMVTLCTVSPFWVTWLLQRNLGAAVDLAQIINLTWIWFARTFMSPTPRQTIEWTAPTPFDYASYYNYFLFYSTVSLCYATIQPIVLPVTFIYFVVDCWLKKYLLMYIFITKTESGGQFWNVLFNRVLFATLLANCIAAIVIKAAFGSWTMLGCMAPLPILLLSFKIYCSRAFEDQCRYYIKALSVKDIEALPGGDKKGEEAEIIRLKFEHPALTRKLIAPMVHAKAEHILKDLGTGQINFDGTSPIQYSDFAMRPMSKTEAGKVGDQKDEMFDYVPEAKLDFAYYKNKPEFSDEFGGGGELYEQQPQTPSGSSILNSAANSRSGSPAPSFVPGRTPPRYGPGAHHGPIGMSARSREMYMHNNDSQSDRYLLSDPQSVGVAEDVGRKEYFDGQGHQQEQLAFAKWRTGGSGYVGVPGAADDESLEYDAYRVAAKGPL
ncbi:Transmembrane protein 63C [Lambiella insularis]|nr:Transmembrane protein 63C [Lambiella insularis]